MAIRYALSSNLIHQVKIPKELEEVVKRLNKGSLELGEIEKIFIQGQGIENLAHLYYYLQQLVSKGWLEQNIVTAKGEQVAIVQVIARKADFNNSPIPSEKKYRISRFACTRREDDQYILESPLSPIRCILHHWKANGILALLSQPVSARVIATEVNFSIEIVSQFISVLLNAGLILPVHDEEDLESKNTSLRHWEFHDLWCHWRSRMGKHKYPVGATYRFKDEISSLPAWDEKEYLEEIPLEKPDLQILNKEDIPLSSVIESMKSRREYETISAKQVGELLYRSSRIQYISKVDVAKGWMYDLAKRPYPCGGGIYEQEIYLCIHECEGLEKGLYHYDPKNHKLGLMTGTNKYTEKLLREAARSGIQNIPPIFVIITARFARVMWKYQSAAYSLILKNTGVLMEQMSLIAESMDLASCIIGAGNTDTFEKTLGIPFYQESPVGEMALGGKRKG